MADRPGRPLALEQFYTDGASQTDEGTALGTVWLWPRIEASYL